MADDAAAGGAAEWLVGGEPVAGACADLCPRAEAEERTRCKFLSACEGGAARRPLVKRYTRSAAGAAFGPADLRPEPVLLRAVDYLLRDLLGDPALPPGDSYGFVSDRLRSVRQDAAIQQLCSLPLARALLAMARYHVCVGRVLAAAGARQRRQNGRSPSLPQQLGGSGDDSGGWDPVMNDARLSECVGHGLGVTEELMHAAAAASGGEAGGTWSPTYTEAAALHGELLAYRLALSFLEPGVPGGALRTLARTHHRQLAQLPIAIVLSFLRRWAARDWKGFLLALDELGASGSGGGSGDAHGSRAAERVRTLLWCALQRYMPLCRLQLVRAFAEAFPSRLALPVSALAELLQFHGGDRQLCGDGGDDAAAADSSPFIELPWQQAARLCVQLKQPTYHRPHGAGDSSGASAHEQPLDAQLLHQLHRAALVAAALDAAGAPPPPSPPLFVHFDKSADLDPRSMDIRVRTALTPLGAAAEAPPAVLALPRDGAELSALVLEPLGGEEL